MWVLILMLKALWEKAESFEIALISTPLDWSIHAHRTYSPS